MVTSKHPVGGQRSVSAGCAIVAEMPKSHPSLRSTTVVSGSICSCKVLFLQMRLFRCVTSLPASVGYFLAFHI